MIRTIRTSGSLASDPAQRRPNQFHIDMTTGRCARGRAAGLWQLLGFASHAESRVIEITRENFKQVPWAAIGKFPVFVDIPSGVVFALLEKVINTWAQGESSAVAEAFAGAGQSDGGLTAVAEAVGVLREAGQRDG